MPNAGPMRWTFGTSKRVLGGAWPLLLALSWVFVPACVNPRMVTLDNVDVAVERSAAAGWRADVGAVLERYKAAPVVSAGDPRFEAIFGGVATLVYSGADLDQKVRDQRIPEDGPATGASLRTVCQASPSISAAPSAGQATSSVVKPAAAVAEPAAAVAEPVPAAAVPAGDSAPAAAAPAAAASEPVAAATGSGAAEAEPAGAPPVVDQPSGAEAVKTPPAEPAPPPAEKTVNASPSPVWFPSPARPSVPAPLSPVWFPIAIDGGAPPAGAACGERGQPLGGKEHFCMFGRLTLGASPRPLVVVVHGMFDSSAQDYVRRIAVSLHEMGYASLLLDMRDHGDTFRAAPHVPTGFGQLEAADLLAVAERVRSDCAPQVERVGALGFSGGGLAVAMAHALDAREGEPVLDAGAVALSPLVDSDRTAAALDADGSCSIGHMIELTWQEHLLFTVTGAAATGGGAVIVKSLEEQPVDEDVAVAAAFGAVSGLIGALFTDLMFDGDSVTNDDCVPRGAVGAMFRDLVRMRWQTLRGLGPASGLSGSALALAPEEVDLDRYMQERTEAFYSKRGHTLPRPTPGVLSGMLHERSQRTKGRGRLLLLAAEDDPVTPIDAYESLRDGVGGLAEVMVATVPRGGHGAMWVVHEPLTRVLIDRVLRPTSGGPASGPIGGKPVVGHAGQ